jgi:hypothetical protein
LVNGLPTYPATDGRHSSYFRLRYPYWYNGDSVYGVSASTVASIPIAIGMSMSLPTNITTQKKLKAETFSFVGGTYHPPMYRVLPLLLMY